MALLRPEVRTALSDGRSVVVRSATPHDARAVGRLLDEVAAEPGSGLLMLPGEISRREWRKRIGEHLHDPDTLYLLAEVDGQPAGCLGLHRDPARRTSHVRQMGVSVAAPLRRVGLGDLLVATALDWARVHGVVKVELGLFAHNAAARALYEKHGFAVEGLRRAHYLRRGEYFDEVIMACFLADEGRP